MVPTSAIHCFFYHCSPLTGYDQQRGAGECAQLTSMVVDG
jgi:hypothetical protein